MLAISHSIRYDVHDFIVETWGVWFDEESWSKIGEYFLVEWRYMTPTEIVLEKIKMDNITLDELRSLLRFRDGDGGWGDPNLDRLMELHLVDYEESTDGTTFWVTEKGQSYIDAVS